MKILFYSIDGNAAPIAFHLKQFENCDVWIYYEKPEHKNLLKGYIDIVNSLQEGLAKNPDLIIFDSTSKGKLANQLATKYKVIGANAICDELESNRKFGLEIMKIAGIKIPPSKEFTSLDEVQKEVLATNKRYVLKPEGYKSPETTYIAETAEEMYRYIEYLKHLPKEWTGKKFILQEFVDGIEISTEMWFSQGKPVFPINYTFEEKRRDPLNLGPIIGCASSVVYFSKSREPKMVQKLFKRLYLLMEKAKYTGPIDINSIVTQNGDIFGLEWTPRFGYNAIFCLFELLTIPISEFFMKLANGTLNTIPAKNEFGFAVRVHTSPYPVDLGSVDNKLLQKQIYSSKHGLPIIWQKEDLRHIWPCDVELSENGPIVSGIDLIICEISNSGKTIQEAKQKVKVIFDRTLVPSKSARIADAIDRAVKEYPEAVKLGFR